MSLERLIKSYLSHPTSPQPPPNSQPPETSALPAPRIISTTKRTPHISLQPYTLLSQGISNPYLNTRSLIWHPAVHIKHHHVTVFYLLYISFKNNPQSFGPAHLLFKLFQLVPIPLGKERSKTKV